jgi:hypothetical protein
MSLLFDDQESSDKDDELDATRTKTKTEEIWESARSKEISALGEGTSQVTSKAKPVLVAKPSLLPMIDVKLKATRPDSKPSVPLPNLSPKPVIPPRPGRTLALNMSSTKGDVEATMRAQDVSRYIKNEQTTKAKSSLFDDLDE